MVFSIHDFTDSEPESEEAQPLHPVSEPVESASGIYSREPSEASVPQDSPFRAGPSTETHPLRVTVGPPYFEISQLAKLRFA